MTMADEVFCTVCDQTRENHKGLQHPFTAPGQPEWVPPAKPERPKPGVKGDTRQVLVAPMPDLVLRHALVKAGILTSEQLGEAENDLRVGGGNTYQVPPHQADS
jgi:hypothetical protein